MITLTHTSNYWLPNTESTIHVYCVSNDLVYPWNISYYIIHTAKYKYMSNKSTQLVLFVLAYSYKIYSPIKYNPYSINYSNINTHKYNSDS